MEDGSETLCVSLPVSSVSLSRRSLVVVAVESLEDVRGGGGMIGRLEFVEEGEGCRPGG